MTSGRRFGPEIRRLPFQAALKDRAASKRRGRMSAKLRDQRTINLREDAQAHARPLRRALPDPRGRRQGRRGPRPNILRALRQGRGIQEGAAEGLDEDRPLGRLRRHRMI